MGARGKKRKRANGSTATGQRREPYAPLLSRLEDPVAEVPAEAILEIMPFMINTDNLSDAELEVSDPDYRDALEEIAIKYDAEADALEYRATRLGYVVESMRPDLLEKSSAGTLIIDPRLLEYISTFDPRDAAGMIKWVNAAFPLAQSH